MKVYFSIVPKIKLAQKERADVRAKINQVVDQLQRRPNRKAFVRRIIKDEGLAIVYSMRVVEAHPELRDKIDILEIAFL